MNEQIIGTNGSSVPAALTAGAGGGISTARDRNKVAYYLVLLLWVFYAFKPEWTIPGMKAIAPLQTFTQIALLLLWAVYSKKNLRDPVALYFFLFIAVLTLSTLMARNNGIGRDALRAMIFFYITYLTTVTFVDSDRRITRLFTILIVGNLYLAILSIKGGGLVRGVTIFQDQNDMALNMNIYWPVALFLGLGERSTLRKILFFSAVIVLITAVIISNSRGGVLGLLAVTAFVWWKLPVNKIKSTLLIVLLAAGVFMMAPQSFWDKMDTLRTEGVDRGTSASRLFLWQVATAEFIDNPLLGVGVGNFGVWLPDYVNDEVEFDRSAMSKETTFYGRVCHSIYFTVLCESGAFGMLFFVLLIIRLFKLVGLDRSFQGMLRTLRSRQAASKGRDPIESAVITCRNLSLGVTGGLIGLLISGAFITVLYYPQFWLLCTLCVILGDSRRRLQQSVAP